MQLAVCEFARNTLGWAGNAQRVLADLTIPRGLKKDVKEAGLIHFCFMHVFFLLLDANSTEFDPESKHPVVHSSFFL